MKKQWYTCVISSVLLTLSLGSFAKDTVTGEALYEAAYESDTIYLQPLGEYQSFTLRVSGPGEIQYELKFDGGDTPLLGVTDDEGNMLPDGQYNFELKGAPFVDAEMRAILRQARLDGLEPVEIPRGKVESGSFSVFGGEIIVPESEAVVFNKGDEEPTTTTPTGYPAPDADPGRDVVHLDDTIVTGSLCAGFDCVNGESFGFDTIRMKENNLRMHFQDTSTSASFPANDWRIVANDSSNGGANYLAFEDSDAGRIPFRVEAGARVNALYVESDGDVGIGTSNPVVEIHMVSGNTPTLRLEQDGSSGFTPQTWDVAGNETNFFIRDATNGSPLPFRIRPGAPQSSIYIDTDGDVGLGTAAPSAGLDVVGTSELNGNVLVTEADVSLKILDTNTTGTTSRILLNLENKGPASMVIKNTGGGANRWEFGVDNQGLKIGDNINGAALKMRTTGEAFFTDFAGATIATITSTGNLCLTGTVTCASDRNKKENFTDLNAQDVLAKVAAMPLTSWNYKADDEDVRHIGPMSQDFHAAFGLGNSDLTISPMDSAGVALASIKALADMNDAKDVKISELEQQVQDQEARLLALEKLLIK